MLKAIFIIIYIFLSVSVDAQNCSNYHKRVGEFNKYKPLGFLYGSQSTSITFEINETYNTDFVFYGNRDYVINFYIEKKYLPIQFKVKNTNTNELLFDNSSDEKLLSLGFSIAETTPITIECKVLAKNINPANFDENRGCLGVLILYKPTPKLGFKSK
jgi:hypothetical protein